MEDASQIESMVLQDIDTNRIDWKEGSSPDYDQLRSGPAIYSAEFDIDKDEIADTYIDTTGWGKV